MRNEWTVGYRTWIGTSKHGVLFLWARRGRGHVIARPHLLPEYVRDFLQITPIDPARADSCYWTWRDLDPDTLSPGSVRYVRTPRWQSSKRFRVVIPRPPRPEGVPAASPRSLARLTGTDSPYQWYRQIYRDTDCGPSIGLRVSTGTYYCRDLSKLGTWEDMAKAGQRVHAVIVSSMVEGTDAEVPAEEVSIYPQRTFLTVLADCIAEVDRSAKAIWENVQNADADVTL